MKKKYRVCARCTSYLYLDVWAESEEEARELGEDADGGEFEESPTEACWEIVGVDEV